MNLASPAPKVEAAEAEPVRESSSVFAVPARNNVDEAVLADPAQQVEPAETVDDPRKHAPSNALSYLQQRANMSVETLRKEGTDFESRAAVCRGAPKKNFLKVLLPMLFDHRDFVTFSEIARYAVIQGGVCFIYLESTDTEPLYAFSLADVVPELEDPENPDKASCTVSPVANTNKSRESLKTVLLRNRKTKKVAHQFSFETEDDKGVVKKFVDVVQRNGGLFSKPVVEAKVVGQDDKVRDGLSAIEKEAT